MVDALTPFESGTDRNQAVRFHSRERRRSLAGVPELFRTHRIFGGSTMAVDAIPTSDIFPSPALSRPVTMKTAIRITENSGTHVGIAFEFGAGQVGIAVWLEDDKIGFHAGAREVTGEGANAIFDNGAELPVGAEIELVVACRPGDGRCRLWGNGRELARAVSTNATMLGGWSGTANGSFATQPKDTIITDVPVGSRVAPDGFELIEPLSIYVGQVPRHFV